MLAALKGEKFQRAVKWDRRHSPRKKFRKLTRHHNIAQHFGGRGNGYKGNEDYLAMLDAEHHALFHKLFGLRTFRQAADVLIRLDNMKRMR